MKYVYPALFEYRDDEISVRFPDLPGCITAGKDMADTLCMAQDAAAMWLAVTEDKKEQIPPATPLSQIQTEAGTASLVLADTDAWRAQFDNRAVKKTLTIGNL